MNSNNIFKMGCIVCEMKDSCIYFDTQYVGEDCKHYGNRLLDYPKCQPCDNDLCMRCSILTLEKVLSGHPRKIEVLTPAGRSVVINEPKEV